MRPLAEAAYRRGFLDGSGNRNRATGQSFRAYLKALLSASEGKKVGFISSTYKMSNYNARKIINIAENYGYVFEYVSSAPILTFENDSFIRFLVHEDTTTDDHVRGLDCVIYDLT